MTRFRATKLGPCASLSTLGAGGMGEVHRAGVVHRRLKPRNIMLAKSAAELMDFGPARATHTAGAAGGSGTARSPVRFLASEVPWGCTAA